jgi:hypothetical protein
LSPSAWWPPSSTSPADICQQRICTPADLETAVTLGLGYPLGPLAMGDRWGPTNVLEVLFNMQTVYGDPRYRPSPWLRRRGAIGLSLLHVKKAESPRNFAWRAWHRPQNSSCTSHGQTMVLTISNPEFCAMRWGPKSTRRASRR